MKICFVGNFTLNSGWVQHLYQYSRNSREIGVDMKFAGFIDNRIKRYFRTESKPERMREEHLKGKWYPIDRNIGKKSDFFVFTFDSSNYLHPINCRVELNSTLENIRRDRTFIIDADGKYNPRAECFNDTNHETMESYLSWQETFNSLSEFILQPSVNAGFGAKPFIFWTYYEQAIKPDVDLDIVYVGSNWFRQERVEEFFRGLSGLRKLYPRVSIIGRNWLNKDPHLTDEANKINGRFFLDNLIEVIEREEGSYEYLKNVGRARFSPILIRPILSYMKMFTPRMLETFASGTTPILPNYFDYAEALYGPEAEELRLGDDPEKKLRDMAENEPRYIAIANRIRDKLRREHSFQINRLINIIKQHQ